MNKQIVTNFFSNVGKSIVKHSPEILTTIGIVSMASATVLAVKATPKALKLIEEKKNETEQEELTVVETVKTCWKPYVPAAVSGVFGAACLIGAHSVHAKRNAALATAYQLSTTAFNEYREKVVETIGEKKEKTVRDNIAKDKMEKNPVSQANVILTDNKSTTLCYDPLSDRYFKSDRNKIDKAVNELNHAMSYGSEMYVSLNDFYSAIGLQTTITGNTLGWRVDRGLIDIYYSAQLTDDDTPCMVLNFLIPPEWDYNNFY